MLEVCIIVALSIALIKSVYALVQQKDFILATQGGKSLYVPLISFPLLYFIAFATSIIPFIHVIDKCVIALIACIPGIIITKKARGVFETSCDRSYDISRHIGLLCAIGIAGLLVAIVLPMLFFIAKCVLMRNIPITVD